MQESHIPCVDRASDGIRVGGVKVPPSDRTDFEGDLLSKASKNRILFREVRVPGLYLSGGGILGRLVLVLAAIVLLNWFVYFVRIDYFDGRPIFGWCGN
jgi:hypothetical protein